MDSPDWKLLRALFPAGESFRHKMGLQRREFGEFYAPTAAGEPIRQEKREVFGEGPSEYLAVSADGQPVLQEFAGLLGETLEGDGSSLRALSLQIEPDFMLLTPPDWKLVCASVCFPSRWSLAGKLGLPLSEVHAAVPGLNAELGQKISTFFARMMPGEGWGRANWGLSASERRNQHPTLPIPALNAATPAGEIFIRVEDQHLCKLPHTGAMAFGIRVYSYRLSDVAGDDALAEAVREKLRTMPSDVARYKGLADFLREAGPQTALDGG